MFWVDISLIDRLRSTGSVLVLSDHLDSGVVSLLYSGDDPFYVFEGTASKCCLENLKMDKANGMD